MIYVYRKGKLCETDSLRQALKLEYADLRGQRPVISAVGAGGKTTTLHRLADEFVSAHIPVIVTTTTHIVKEDSEWFLSGFQEDRIKEQLQKWGQVWVGEPAAEGKLSRLSDSGFDKLLQPEFPPQKNAAVLIEADGARRLPLKVPAEHEPVIPPCTTHVLSVYGLDSLGKKIEETVFRPEAAEQLLNKKTTECVTAEDIALLAASRSAGRKGCPDTASYTVVLNKADDEKRRNVALEICRELDKRGVRQIIVTGAD